MGTNWTTAVNKARAGAASPPRALGRADGKCSRCHGRAGKPAPAARPRPSKQTDRQGVTSKGATHTRTHGSGGAGGQCGAAMAARTMPGLQAGPRAPWPGRQGHNSSSSSNNNNNNNNNAPWRRGALASSAAAGHGTPPARARGSRPWRSPHTRTPCPPRAPRPPWPSRPPPARASPHRGTMRL